MLPRNLTLADRVLRVLLAVLAGWIALYAFHHIAAQVAAGLAALWLLFEAAMGTCPLHKRMGVRSPNGTPEAKKLFFLALVGVQIVLAYVWWHAGWEKINGPFASELAQTFARFASENPYPLYKQFLETVGMANAPLFGQLVQWSQLSIGAVLFIAAIALVYGSDRTKILFLVLSIAALFGGALMNANFWLAGAWTGPGTATSNVVMFWPQLLLMYVWFELLRHPLLRTS